MTITPQTTSETPASPGGPDNPLRASSHINVPQHVVYRSFPSETVVLNLETGKYHGLNATAGRMLEELERSRSVGEAVQALMASLQQPQQVIERDVSRLCLCLEQRGLIAIEADADDGEPA
jgi:hypothetical protein